MPGKQPPVSDQTTSKTTGVQQDQQQSVDSNAQSQDQVKAAEARVPRTPDEVIAAIRTAFGERVAAYESATKTAREEYKPLVEEIKGYAPGTMTKEQSKDFLGRFMAISNAIAAETGSTQAKDLRSIYVDAEEMMAEWQHALETAGEDVETIARLMHMYRETKKMFVRELMVDENAVACLNGRDTALYGQPMGPTFDQLMEQAMAKGAENETAAHNQIIGSSKRSNADVNRQTGATSGGGGSG